MHGQRTKRRSNQPQGHSELKQLHACFGSPNAWVSAGMILHMRKANTDSALHRWE